MKEIGGYFGLESFAGKEYHDELIGVNSARNALLYILKAKHIRKIYIPRLLCDTVYMLCRREGFEFEEYSIDETFMPVFDRDLEPDEYIYVVNFYGQISDDQILRMKEHWENLILDNVQDFFRKPVHGIDTVYSCRKFFGVPDGGYVSTDASFGEVLPLDSSKDRMRHILGRFEESGSAYYRDFQENDERFYEAPLRRMSPLTRNILRAVDYDLVRNKRNENFAVLHAMLGENNRLHLRMPEGPYCYPFYCENGMNVKKQLAAQKIYVATLWPNVLQYDGTLEKDYAENILPLPCDQRYDVSDMERIVACLQELTDKKF